MTSNPLNELTPAERVALLRPLKKQIDAALKDAEGDMRDGLLDAYKTDGTDRRAIIVGGRDVGKASVVMPKLRAEILPGREAEALAFLREYGLTSEQPAEGWRDRFAEVAGEAVFTDTGEVCPWACFAATRAPFIRYSGLKVEDVRDAFQARGGIDMGAMLALTEGSE